MRCTGALLPCASCTIEAAKLLKDGRYTIAEVSTMVGFNTPSYFATSFKKYFGCLPTEYIKKAKG